MVGVLKSRSECFDSHMHHMPMPEDKDSMFPNCVNLNLYEHGDHQVAWHSDDEPLFRGKFQDHFGCKITRSQIFSDLLRSSHLLSLSHGNKSSRF